MQDEKTRVEKDIQKLENLLREFEETGYSKKYHQQYEYAKNYLEDAKHFLSNKDYFTAFGAVNYAYGFIDAVLILEGKK